MLMYLKLSTSGDAISGSGSALAEFQGEGSRTMCTLGVAPRLEDWTLEKTASKIWRGLNDHVRVALEQVVQGVS